MEPGVLTVAWGEPHEPSPSPAAATGTSRQIADAVAALATVGIERDHLALAAIEAAGQIDRLRHLVTRLLTREESALPEAVAVALTDVNAIVERNLHQLIHGST